MGLFELTAAGATFMAPAFSLAFIFPLIAGEGGAYAPVGVVLGALAAILVALSFAEMSKYYTRAGGAYSMVSGEISPLAGFTAGWGLTILYLVGPAIPLLLVVDSLVYLLSIPVAIVVPLTLGIALAVFTVNALGLRPSTRIAFLFFLVEAVILLVVAAILFTKPAVSAPVAGSPLGMVSAVGYAAVWTVFLFLGFESVTTFSEEAQVPLRDIGRGTVFAIGIASAIYLVCSLAFTRAVPAADWNLGFVGGLSGFIGPTGNTLLTLVVLTSSMGALIAVENTCARLFFAMGRDRMLPPQLSVLLGRGNAPLLTLGVSAIVTAGLIAWFEGTTGSLAGPADVIIGILPGMLTLGALIAYFLVSVAALLRLRKEKRGLFLLVPLAGTLVTGALIAIQFLPSSIFFSADTLVGVLVWFLIGAVLLLGSRRVFGQKARTPEEPQVAVPPSVS